MAVDPSTPYSIAGSDGLIVGKAGITPADQYDFEWGDKKPDDGRVFRIRREDQMENPWPANLSPRHIRSVLNSAAQGQPQAQHEAFDQMMEADPKLSGIYDTRLNTIRNRPWEIIPASEVSPDGSVDEALANEVAQYCRQVFVNTPMLDDALFHLLDAIGSSVSVCELVWTANGGHHELYRIVPVNHRSVIGDPTYPWKIRIRTTDAPFPGVLVDAMPNKWAIHTPRQRGMNPFRGGTHRICLVLSMERRFGAQWWMSGLEQFGVPYRTAKYGATTSNSAALKTELENALKNFGNSGYGIFPNDCEIEMLMSMQGSDKWPHEKLIAHIDDCYAILLLGQTLTTDPGDKGTQALGTVHDKVRADMRDADITAEGRTVRRDILTPIVRLGPFPPDAPVPYFRRVVEEPKDHVNTLAVLQGAVNSLGLKITNATAYTMLDLPLPDDVDPNEFVKGAPMATAGGLFGDLAAPPKEPDTDDEKKKR